MHDSPLLSDAPRKKRRYTASTKVRKHLTGSHRGRLPPQACLPREKHATYLESTALPELPTRELLPDLASILRRGLSPLDLARVAVVANVRTGLSLVDYSSSEIVMNKRRKRTKGGGMPSRAVCNNQTNDRGKRAVGRKKREKNTREKI